MDPLINLCDVHDLIFQHLSVDEVLEVSLVARIYYKTIGKSVSAMRKVWLNIGDRFNEPNREDLKAFRASERNYENFKMSEIENGLQILLFPKRRWKRGQIDIQSFLNYRDFVNLLEIFHETIEELEIFDMDIEFVENHRELKFEKLNKLKFGFVTTLAMQPFMMNLVNLKELILEDVRDFDMKFDGKSSEAMIRFLELQPQLTHLSLFGDTFEKIFEKSHNFEFKLTNLLIEFSGNSESHENLMENFKIFLSSQNNSLKSITLCEWTDKKLLQFLFNSSNVSRISFDYFDADSKKIDTNLLKLEENHNLSRLDFEVENMDLNWEKVFLVAASKVETLYFFHLNQEVFEFVLKNCKCLKTLKYCSVFEGLKDFLESTKDENDEISRILVVEEKFNDFRSLS